MYHIQPLERRLLFSAAAPLAAPDPRLAWWQDSHFGMFIHWGLYSQLAGHWNGQTTPGLGEWIEHDLNIPPDLYAQVASEFDPTQFNAQQWVSVAKSAGMKYIVVTSKHHDGFGMFRTSVNSFNVVDATPWHHDPLADLSAAAHAAGLHFGVYYSILNWQDPNASAAGIDTYMQTMETQLRELITQYSPDILWFDGNWPDWWTEQRGFELEAFVRNLDPAILINNRVAKLPSDGDFDTPEQVIPTSEPPGRPWETAMTINDTWGYKDTDTDWKSAATIVNDLKEIEGRGGNYLLNVGPTGSGVIPPAEVQILQQVGAMLGVAGNSGSGGSGSGSAGGTGTPPATPPFMRTVDLVSGRKASYLDSMGHHVTVLLRGPGSGRLVFDSPANSDVSQIILDGTDPRSALSIRGDTAVGEVVVNGGFSGILAPTVDLAGDVTITGGVGRLQIRSATGGHTISAASIGLIRTTGNLSDNVRAASIAGISIGAAIASSDIRASTSIGPVRASMIQDSRIFAGVRADLSQLPSAASDFVNTASTVTSVAIRGHGSDAFADSQIAGWNVGAVSLGQIKMNHAGIPFGLAAHRVSIVSASVANHQKVFHALRAAAIIPLGGDCVVRLV